MSFYLFSIDLEDIRFRMPDGQKYAERVPKMTNLILSFLARHEATCTFFTTGDVARAYPELIREIADAGHELACHTDTHLPLERLNRETFRNDLNQNRDSLLAAGAKIYVVSVPHIFLLLKKHAGHTTF